MNPVLYTALVTMLATASAADVSLVTSDSQVRMSKYRGSIKLIYRNNSEGMLSDVRLTTHTEIPVEVEVRPEIIPRCLPADRCVFEIEIKRTSQTPEERFAILVKLQAANQPDLHQRKLFVDATPQALSRERGWMEAGQIKVGTRSQTSRVLVLTLVCAVPVILLLGLGLYFKKRATR